MASRSRRLFGSVPGFTPWARAGWAGSRLAHAGHAPKPEFDVTHLLDAAGTCRVLVADDDPDAADTLVELLRAWGISAQAVYDGDQAVLAEEALQPSLVILDIGMPTLDGYCAASAIRRASSERQVTLVALTGRDSEADRVLSACVGFDALVRKPIGRARLHLLALEAGARAHGRAGA